MNESQDIIACDKLDQQCGAYRQQQKRSRVLAQLLNAVFPTSCGGKWISPLPLTFLWDEWDNKQCRISPIGSISRSCRSQVRNLRGFQCPLSWSLYLKLLQQKLKAWFEDFVDNNERIGE